MTPGGVDLRLGKAKQTTSIHLTQVYSSCDIQNSLTSLIISRSVVVAYLLPFFMLFEHLQSDVAKSRLPLHLSSRLVVQYVK